MKARLTDVFVKATIEPNDRLCRGLLTITFQKLAAQPAPRLASKCSRLLKMTISLESDENGEPTRLVCHKRPIMKQRSGKKEVAALSEG